MIIVALLLLQPLVVFILIHLRPSSSICIRPHPSDLGVNVACGTLYIQEGTLYCIVPLPTSPSTEHCIFRKEPVRFDSFRFRTFRKLIGSVRFGSDNSISRFDVVRPAFFGRVVARSGSVRFVSVSGSGRFQIKQFGSVWLFRFGFLFLPVVSLLGTGYWICCCCCCCCC